jgi:small subunit ribosomal protein S9
VSEEDSVRSELASGADDIVTTTPEEAGVESTSEPLTTSVAAAADIPSPAEVSQPPATTTQVTRRRSGPPQTVGRRKESVVRVRLLPGSGNFTLNGKSLDAYFPNKVHQQIVKEPLVTLEKAEQFDVVATLRGGGTSGQAGALRLAVARALVESEPDDRPALKRAGFLTRDPRVKERKKYGLKKARKAPQYSKR